MGNRRRARWTVAAVLALAWLRCAPAEACRPTASIAFAKPARVAALHVRRDAGRLPPASPPVAHPAQAPVKTVLAGRRDDDHGRGGTAVARFAPATARGGACHDRRPAVTTGDDHGAADAASFHEAHAPPGPALLLAGRRS
jgi:hypothetical protein